MTTIKALAITIFGVSILAINHAQAGPKGCPESQYAPVEGQVLAWGIGNTKSLAIKQAYDDLLQQTGSSDVENQFISESTRTSSNERAYLSVEQQGKFESTRIETETLRCNKNTFVSYLLFDKRSLITQISSVFGQNSMRLIGEDYLIKSPALAPFNVSWSELHANVGLSYHHDRYQLAFDQELMEFHPNEFLDVINPVPPSYDRQTMLRVFQNLYGGKDLAINTPEVASNQEFDLYVCDLFNRCYLMHTKIQSNQTYTVGLSADVSKEKLFLFAIPKNSQSELHSSPIVLAHNLNLLNLIKLAYANERVAVAQF